MIGGALFVKREAGERRTLGQEGEERTVAASLKHGMAVRWTCRVCDVCWERGFEREAGRQTDP